jgi:hypothetical protein
VVATEAGTESVDRAAAARVGAALVALFWAVLFFGIIDLSVAIVPSEYPDFTEHMVFETSWGLLYTCMIPMPLIAWAVRPVGWVGPQLVAVAACVLVAGVAGAAMGQVFVAFLVAGSVAFPRMWRPPPRWVVPWSAARAFRTAGRPVFWPVDVLVLLGLGAALAHAWDVLGTSTAEDENTLGLMHAPMHAAFALAVPVAAAIAVLAMAAAEAHRVGGWWFAVVPAAASAVWFGVVSVRYPDLVGSLGVAGGVLAICWGGALPVLTWGAGWLRRRGRLGAY